MSPQSDIKIEASWQQALATEFTASYFIKLRDRVRNAYQETTIYPPPPQLFRAFNLCPLTQTKVVILGQDPYHGEGQANGLCFSVKAGIPLPPSLKNIFKELKSDIDMKMPENGDLSNWAKQGVLLLNATLTVRKSAAGSHQNKGWEKFTDAIISQLNQNREGLIFLLWGRKAQEKAKHIDREKHFVLKAAHPSPFSAYNGFMGCSHFSKTNELLKQEGKEPIKWQL
jgi:uracil-DNA glycosylase